jgi:Aldehyde dehydrogenase family
VRQGGDGHEHRAGTATSRILVRDGIYDRFVKQLAAAVTKLKVGRGTNPAVHVGPEFGCGSRRFEMYAGDRYQLVPQLLWHDLVAVAPARAVEAVEKARASVDFFVCLFYGGVVTITG